MDILEARKKIAAAQDLLDTSTLTLEKFDSLFTLLKGINPRLDHVLDKIAETIETFHSLKEGDIIELSAKSLPAKTEAEKNRQKKLLLLIRLWKDLREEVTRVKHQMSSAQTNQIITSAKGPFGLLTLAAIVIVGATILFNRPKTATIPTPSPDSTPKIKVITVQGKYIPVTEVATATGPECDGEHYHAKDHAQATATDGSIISDPGGCGLGKVSDLQITEITSSAIIELP